MKSVKLTLCLRLVVYSLSSLQLPNTLLSILNNFLSNIVQDTKKSANT